MKNIDTFFASIPGESRWATAVKTIDQISTGSVVNTRTALTLVDICHSNKHKLLKTELSLAHTFFCFLTEPPDI